jgi:hypothetical protein
LAFTDVVECILRLPQDEDPEENGRRKAMARHLYLSFLSQTCSVTAGRLYKRRIQESIPGSSSPIPEGDTNVEGGGINVWTGDYFVDLELHSRRRWSLGRYSSCFPPDITLTMDRFTGIARQHTYICVDPATRLAYLTALLPDMLTVDSVSPIYTPGTLEPLVKFLRHHSGLQPSPEDLSAAPTPGGTTRTIGSYTLSGVLGAGSFGSVRPAVGPRGDRVVAIKTIISRSKSSGAVQALEHLTRLINASSEPCHIFRMLESFEVAGTLAETHLVLEPFTPITMDKLPVSIQ